MTTCYYDHDGKGPDGLHTLDASQSQRRPNFRNTRNW